MQELPSFDELKRMAIMDPEGLEQLRRQMTDRLIESAPDEHQRRLRGLQFQIDAQRKIASSPSASMNKIYGMLMASFGEMRKTLNLATGHPGTRRPKASAASPVSAEIIPLRRR